MDKNHNIIEILAGIFVIFVALGFILFAYNKSNFAKPDQRYYRISAQFTDIGDLSEGADIKISGIKIGSVRKILLDQSSYNAVVFLDIKKEVQIPEDSVILVATNGIIGSKYLNIKPGAEDVFLQDKDTISLTHSAINIESLVSKIIVALTSKKEPAN